MHGKVSLVSMVLDQLDRDEKEFLLMNSFKSEDSEKAQGEHEVLPDLPPPVPYSPPRFVSAALYAISGS